MAISQFNRDTYVNGPNNGGTAATLKSVVGKVLVSAVFANNELYLEVADGTMIRLFDDAQNCCERRHMSCDDALSTYVGGVILDFELADGPDGGPGRNMYHDTQFLRIHTTKDIITVVNHNEHNGYYGGFGIVATPA